MIIYSRNSFSSDFIVEIVVEHHQLMPVATYRCYSITRNALDASLHKDRENDNLAQEVMVLNSIFNNISVISWRSVLLVEETEENRRPAAIRGQNAVLLVMTGIRTLVVIGTYCKGRCKSNYLTITTTTQLIDN